MMPGVLYTIDQLGQTIIARDMKIAELTAELDQLRAKYAESVQQEQE